MTVFAGDDISGGMCVTHVPAKMESDPPVKQISHESLEFMSGASRGLSDAIASSGKGGVWGYEGWSS